MNKSFRPELREYYHVRVQIERGLDKNKYLHRFNLEEKTLLEEVVRKYEEEGIENFYMNGYRVDPSDSYTISIYRTNLVKESISINTKFSELWTQIVKKGTEVTTDYIKIPSNPWRDTLLVCSRGHVLNSSFKLRPERNSENCPDCGGKALSECPKCGKPLPGDLYKPYFQSIGMYPPSYCTDCAFKFPWTTEEKNYSASLQYKEDSTSRVFISYAREDYETALKLYSDLSSKSELKPWLDKKDLLPGQNWDIEIKKAIKNSRYFIALFSITSVSKKGYVQKEFKRALEILEEFPEGQIFAIPARLDNCEIPYQKFEGIERVDLFPNWDYGLQRLLLSFQTH